MTLEEKKEWVKGFIGEAFIKGVSIKGNVANVVVVSEGGKEKTVKVSLPTDKKY